MVSVEVSGVDLNSVNVSGIDSELDDDPICFVPVVSACFPSVKPGSSFDKVVGFADWWTGGKKVGGGSEEFVGYGEYLGVETGGCEV